MTASTLLGNEREPSRDNVGDNVWAANCDLCEEHYAWRCQCDNALDHFQVPDSDLPLAVDCHPCGMRYVLTRDWVTWWEREVMW